MDRETRIIFDLSGLTKLRVVCRGCTGEILYPIAGPRLLPLGACPHCQQDWGFVRGTDLASQYIVLMQKVIDVRDSLKADLKFEIQEPPECSERRSGRS